jgi:hypothetical protein
MTIKKLLLATAMAVILTTASHAQDANNNDGTAPGQQTDGGAVPPGQQSIDSNNSYQLREDPWFQPAGNDPSWESQWVKNTYEVGGCFWDVRVVYKYLDGHTTDREYRTSVHCTEPHPYVGAGIDEPPPERPVVTVDPPPVTTSACPPLGWTDVTFQPHLEIFTYADGTIIICHDLKLATAIPPARTVGPVVPADPPPPPPPPPPPATTSACPPLGWTNVTFKPGLEIFTYADGTIIICRDLKYSTVIPPAVALPSVRDIKQTLEGNPTPKTQESETPKTQESETPKTPQPPKTDGKTSEKSTQSDSKADNKTGQPDSKADTRPGKDEHSMRTVTHDQPEEHVARTSETRRSSEVRTEGVRELGTHGIATHGSVGEIGGIHTGEMHMSGLGGLGGLGAMHMGGLGGMHMGGLGGFGRR